MNLLYLTILLPLLGFLLLAFSRGRWSENTAATVGVGSIGLTALVTLYVAVDFLSQKPLAYRCLIRRCGTGCLLAPLTFR